MSSSSEGGDRAGLYKKDDNYEIETFEEFKARILDCGVTDIGPYVFQEVDFGELADETWATLSMTGTWFVGCTFGGGVAREELTRRGAMVLENTKDVPFKPFRAFLYRQEEMAACSDTIYDYYMKHHDVRSHLMYSAHDFSITDALTDLVNGKTVVSFMGGHALPRASPLYALIVVTAWQLARAGFLVATGGGPGAMEAGNLGAYMARRSEAEVREAIALMAAPPPRPVEHEYLDRDTPAQVLRRFGPAGDMPSLGVPTFFYGHEPSNLFASLHAKYFDNAVREDVLVKMSHGGIIFAPGSAGTRQELFQAACLNHYAGNGDDFPTVFLGSDFWSAPDIYGLFVQLAQGKKYARWITKADSPDRVLDVIGRHAREKNLPLFDHCDLSLLVRPHTRRCQAGAESPYVDLRLKHDQRVVD